MVKINLNTIKDVPVTPGRSYKTIRYTHGQSLVCVNCGTPFAPYCVESACDIGRGLENEGIKHTIEIETEGGDGDWDWEPYALDELLCDLTGRSPEELGQITKS
jgi:hypothetical protein